MNEPADTGVAAQLAKFWAGWQDVANHPGDLAARNVLLGDAAALVSQISGGYRAVETAVGADAHRDRRPSSPRSTRRRRPSPTSTSRSGRSWSPAAPPTS